MSACRTSCSSVTACDCASCSSRSWAKPSRSIVTLATADSLARRRSFRPDATASTPVFGARQVEEHAGLRADGPGVVGPLDDDSVPGPGNAGFPRCRLDRQPACLHVAGVPYPVRIVPAGPAPSRLDRYAAERRRIASHDLHATQVEGPDLVGMPQESHRAFLSEREWDGLEGSGPVCGHQWVTCPDVIAEGCGCAEIGRVATGASFRGGETYLGRNGTRVELSPPDLDPMTTSIPRPVTTTDVLEPAALTDGCTPTAAALGVSVVIPTKDEARNIGWVLAKLPEIADEVILVDSSSDNTVAVARAVRPDIVVLHEPTPGKGAALRTGFAAATRDVVVMIDADGSM